MNDNNAQYCKIQDEPKAKLKGNAEFNAYIKKERRSKINDISFQPKKLKYVLSRMNETKIRNQ